MPHKEQPDDPDQAAWREIVENYGERADLPPDVDPVVPVDTEVPAAETGSSYGARFEEFGDDVDEAFQPVHDPLEDGFVPLDPEPLHLGPTRTLAWAGVLGAPVVALLATVVVTATDVAVPHWFGWLLVAAFLGGFAYLVITMPRDRDDPWDDGARL